MKKLLQQRAFSHACPACPFAQRLDTVWQVFGTLFSGQSQWWNLSWKMRANSSAPLASLPANEAMHVPWYRVWKLWQLLGAQFFGTIVLMKFVLTLPVKLCMSHRPTFANHLKSLGRTFFWDNRIDEICPENRCQQLCFSVRRFFPTELSPSYFPRRPFRPPCRHSRIAPSHRSSPQGISHGFPSVHPFVASASLLPNRALPKLFPTVSLPSTLSSFPYRSFPPELSPCYFPLFPFRPPCRHSRIAPSHRSSPQAISHGFPSVHPVVTPISLLPTGALPKLFPTASLPSTLPSLPYRSFIGALPKLFPTVSLPSILSSLPYRSFPPELSPSYFPQRPFRPPCRHSRIAPSHRSSPQTLSHGFPFVHPVVTPVSLLPTGALPKLFPTVSLPSMHPVVTPISLLPTGALPKLFPTVSLPSTLSSLPYRSFPQELPPCYFPRFPFRPPCRHSRIAPSHRSSAHAISHCFPSVHPVVTPVSLLPTGALPKLFPTVSLPFILSSLPYRSFPPKLSPSYFPRFPFRPPCRHSRIAPSPRSSPQAISHGFLPRPPSRRFHFDPSTRNSPHAISHGFPSVHPIVASIRSLPTELSPSYFPRFPSVKSVSLPRGKCN